MTTLTEPLRQPAVQQEQPQPRHRRPRPSVQPREQPSQGQRRQQLRLRLHLRLWWRYRHRYRHPTSPSRLPSPLASASYLASWPPPHFLCLSFFLLVYVPAPPVLAREGDETESLLGLASYRISFFYLLCLCSPTYLSFPRGQNSRKGRHKMCSDARRYADLTSLGWGLGGGGPALLLLSTGGPA